LTIPAQQHAEIVKPGDHALQFHPVDQKDRDRDLGLANMIEKGILKVLFCIGHIVKRLLGFGLAGWMQLCRPTAAMSTLVCANFTPKIKSWHGGHALWPKPARKMG
jgi:hypothetical protein